MDRSRLAALATLVIVAFSANLAQAANLFGQSLASKGVMKASNAEVVVRNAAPDFNLLPGLAAQTTDKAEGPYFTLD